LIENEQNVLEEEHLFVRLKTNIFDKGNANRCLQDT